MSWNQSLKGLLAAVAHPALAGRINKREDRNHLSREISLGSPPLVADVLAPFEQLANDFDVTLTIKAGADSVVLRHVNNAWVTDTPWDGEDDIHDGTPLADFIIDVEQWSGTTDQLCRIIRHLGDSVSLHLRVYFDKRTLAADGIYVFSTVDDCIGLLAEDAASWPMFENHWIPDEGRRTLVYVAGLQTDAHFIGISFLGLDSEAPARIMPAEDVKHIQTSAESVKTLVNWNGRPARITPHTLYPQEIVDDALHRVVGVLREKMAAFLLASIVLETPEGDALYLKGASSPFVVTSTDRPEPYTGISVLFRWGYHDEKVTERLAILRQVVSDEFNHSEFSLRALSGSASEILEKCMAAYHEQAMATMEAYFKKKKEADDAVSKFVQDTHKDVLSLVKDSTDALSKTVGAGIVAAGLALFKETNGKQGTVTTIADFIVWLAIGGMFFFIFAAGYHVWTISEVERDKITNALSRVDDAKLRSRHHEQLTCELEKASNRLQGQARLMVWLYSTLFTLLVLWIICVNSFVRSS